MNASGTRNLRVAAYFNRQTKSWVARHRRITRRSVDMVKQEENLYGYGSKLMEALEGVVAQVRLEDCRVLCRVLLPDKHLTRVQVNFTIVSRL
jgi:hypothetical protein